MPGERVDGPADAGQPLPYEDGEVTFRFPLVVAPRYIPGCPLPGPPVGRRHGRRHRRGARRLADQPPVLLPGFPNPVRLSLTVDIDPPGCRSREIRSQPARRRRGGRTDGRTIVPLQPGERLDRDFILRFPSATASSQRVACRLPPTPAETGDEGTFPLTLVPPAGARPVRGPRDVALVLDRSGSMGGWKMVAARRAMARMIDTLTGRRPLRGAVLRRP